MITLELELEKNDFANEKLNKNSKVCSQTD